MHVKKKVSPPPHYYFLKNEIPEISIRNGHLLFKSRYDFEQLFLLPNSTRSLILKQLNDQYSFISFYKKRITFTAGRHHREYFNCEVPDSLIENNAEFFSLLDVNGVVEIDTFLLRYDYCNKRIWVISSVVADDEQYYNAFLQGDTTNSNLGWFYTYVDVLEALAQNYQTMPDTSLVNEHEIFDKSPSGIPLHEWKYFYDNTDEESSPNNTRMDGKLAFDKFGIYFHLYGKEKYQRHTWLGWQTVSYGTRNWLVDYQFKYMRKGRNIESNGSGTLQPSLNGENKVGYTFYSGSRGLKKYDIRWDVRNYTQYHAVYRKAGGSTEIFIGTFANLPSNTSIHVYNYFFNLIINFGSPNYYRYTSGYSKICDKMKEKVLYIFFVIVLYIFFLNNLSAQPWTISFKPGATFNVNAPGYSSKGYAYKTTSYFMPYPHLAIEISKVNKSGRHVKFCGIGLYPVMNSFDFNEKNINLSKAYGGILRGGDYAIQVYFGIEKKIRKENLPAFRNYFSVFSCIGLGYYIFRPESGQGVTITHFAETNNGQQLTGTEFGYSRYVTGAPSVISGFRYNISNLIGKTVASVDLSANFGLVRYFSHKVSYQIDGVDQIDYLSQKSWNIQLSVAIPLKTFERTKNKKK